MVSGVGLVTGVLDRSPHPLRGRGGLGVFDLDLLLWWDMPLCHGQTNVFGSCKKSDKISVWLVRCWKPLLVGFLKA